MPMYQARAKQLQDANHQGTAVAALTGPMKVRAATAVFTAAGGGTEVAAGGGYATGGTAMAWDAATTATPSRSVNQAASWANWPRVETVVGLDVTDSNASPVKTVFGPLASSKAMNTGDTLSLAAGAITDDLQ